MCIFIPFHANKTWLFIHEGSELKSERYHARLKRRIRKHKKKQKLKNHKIKDTSLVWKVLTLTERASLRTN